MKKFVSILFMLMSFGLTVSCFGGETPSEETSFDPIISVEESSEEESIFNPFESHEETSEKESSIEEVVSSEILTGPDTPAPSENDSVVSVYNPTVSENNPTTSSDETVDIIISEDADSGDWDYPTQTN